MVDDRARLTVGALVERLDEGWRSFQRALTAFPAERLEEPIGGGWTRKQMIAHITAWHVSAAERLAAFASSGERPPPADEDGFNARVARVAAGRTSGEVLGELDASYTRLRRQVGYLADEQLAAHDGWVVGMLAANTYEHYSEHLPDLRGG